MSIRLQYLLAVGLFAEDACFLDTCLLEACFLETCFLWGGWNFCQNIFRKRVIFITRLFITRAVWGIFSDPPDTHGTSAQGGVEALWFQSVMNTQGG
jgi:hypothetical protein